MTPPSLGRPQMAASRGHHRRSRWRARLLVPKWCPAHAPPSLGVGRAAPYALSRSAPVGSTGRSLTTVPTDTCEDCGAADVRVHLGDAPLCDRCADRRVARLTGLPELVAPPPPFVLIGPDGTRHRMQARPWRAATGIVVELEETGVPAVEGFEFSILGPTTLRWAISCANSGLTPRRRWPAGTWSPLRTGGGGCFQATRLPAGWSGARDATWVSPTTWWSTAARSAATSSVGRLSPSRAGRSASSSRTAASTCGPTPR